jgi:predicted Zn-dependent protease
MRERVLPDLADHLSYAERYIDEGKWQKALVQADAVMLQTPIRLYLNTDGIDLDGPNLKAVYEAIDLWESSIESERLFIIVDDPANADVSIRFVSQIGQEGRYCAGHIEWERTISYSAINGNSCVYKATIDLAISGSKNRKLNLNQLRHAAAHELGHVLGLQDSRKRGDIMAPLDLRRPALKPNREEIQTLLEVRTAAEEIRKQAFEMAL